MVRRYKKAIVLRLRRVGRLQLEGRREVCARDCRQCRSGRDEERCSNGKELHGVEGDMEYMNDFKAQVLYVGVDDRQKRLNLTCQELMIDEMKIQLRTVPTLYFTTPMYTVMESY